MLSGGKDYTTSIDEILFTSGSIKDDRRCFNFTIVDDLLVEGNETFTINIQAHAEDIPNRARRSGISDHISGSGDTSGSGHISGSGDTSGSDHISGSDDTSDSGHIPDSDRESGGGQGTSRVAVNIGGALNSSTGSVSVTIAFSLV